jgi:hypothetical protein
VLVGVPHRVQHALALILPDGRPDHGQWEAGVEQHAAKGWGAGVERERDPLALRRLRRQAPLDVPDLVPAVARVLRGEGHQRQPYPRALRVLLALLVEPAHIG